jgi:hypothetical protein
MHKVDMSPEAISTRLRRLSQLRRLGLLLRKAKLEPRFAEPKAALRRQQTLKSDHPKT